MVPSWKKSLGFWDIISILAYALALDFAESLLVFLGLILLRALVPKKIVRDRFVSKGTTMVFVNALWAIVLHKLMVSRYILLWTVDRYLLCAALYSMSVAVSWALVHRSKTLANHIEALVDRMTVLLYVYVPLGAVSLLIVVMRNIL
jgi:hypothetical protein